MHFFIFLSFLVTGGDLLWAARPDDPPADTCILDLALPAGSTVSVDGAAFVAKHQFTWTELQRGKIYVSTLNVRYPDKPLTAEPVATDRRRRPATFGLRALAAASFVPRSFCRRGIRYDRLGRVQPRREVGRHRLCGSKRHPMGSRPRAEKVRRLHHSDKVVAALFSNDNARLYAAAGKRTWWPGTLPHGKLPGDQANSTRSSVSADISGDGSQLATNDLDGVCRVFQLPSLSVVRELRLYPDDTAYECQTFDHRFGVRFSPDGKRLLAQMTAYETPTTAGVPELDELSRLMRAAGASNSAATHERFKYLIDNMIRLKEKFNRLRKDWDLLVLYDTSSGG